ncbi:MAG: FHA domain-containing protein [Polyangiales bacterium]
MKLRYLLETPTTRLSISGGSVLIGRSLDCDVVIPDARVSRHHALVRIIEDGVELIPLGTQLLTCNGEPFDAPRRLRDGDVVGVAEHRFTLRSEAIAESSPADPWFIERDAGVLLAVGSERFTVGSGETDRWVIPSWSPAAVALEVVGGRLTLEVNADDVSVDGPAHAGDIITLRSGTTVSARGISFRALSLPSDPSKPTTRPLFDELPTAVTLTFLPRGEPLGHRGHAHAPGVPARQALRFRRDAPAALRALRRGELIPDSALSTRLWGSARGGRTDINTLVWRVRKDLATAGLEDVALIERSRGGVRLRVADGATLGVVQG